MLKEFRSRIKTKSVAKVAKVLGESEALLQDLQESPINQVSRNEVLLEWRIHWGIEYFSHYMTCNIEWQAVNL